MPARTDQARVERQAALRAHDLKRAGDPRQAVASQVGLFDRTRTTEPPRAQVTKQTSRERQGAHFRASGEAREGRAVGLEPQSVRTQAPLAEITRSCSMQRQAF